MATATKATAASVAPVVGGTGEGFSDRFVAWVKRHKQLSSWIGAVIVIAAVLFVWQLSTKRRAEEIASRELQGARFAFENQNLRLPRASSPRWSRTTPARTPPKRAASCWRTCGCCKDSRSRRSLSCRTGHRARGTHIGLRPTACLAQHTRTWDASETPQRPTRRPPARPGWTSIGPSYCLMRVEPGRAPQTLPGPLPHIDGL